MSGARRPAAAYPSLRDGPAPSLDALLAAREARVARRASLVAEVRLPVVSVTTVMPGPVKDCQLSRIPFAAALGAIEAVADTNTWPVATRFRCQAVTGPEALVVVEADARAVKRVLVDIEETHPLGRLFDLDVADAEGVSIDRAALGLAPRRCLLCDRPAKECGRARTHSLDDLLTRMEERLDAWQRRPA